MIKAVIFDLDNTIYDYDECNANAIVELQRFAKKKYGLSEESFMIFYDRAKKHVKNRLGNVGASHNRMLYMQRLLEELGELPTKGALELYDVYWDNMLKNMHVFPYVRPLFKKLKERKICIAMLTDLTAHIQHRKIKVLGLEDDIQAFVSSEEAGKEKPAKEAFDSLKEKLICSNKEMLMVGDSMLKDIEGAKKSGIEGILFTKEHALDMDSIIMGYIDDFKDM